VAGVGRRDNGRRLRRRGDKGNDGTAGVREPVNPGPRPTVGGAALEPPAPPIAVQLPNPPGVEPRSN
jgi:hypothetical protein